MSVRNLRSVIKRTHVSRRSQERESMPQCGEDFVYNTSTPNYQRNYYTLTEDSVQPDCTFDLYSQVHDQFPSSASRVTDTNNYKPSNAAKYPGNDQGSEDMSTSDALHSSRQNYNTPVATKEFEQEQGYNRFNVQDNKHESMQYEHPITSSRHSYNATARDGFEEPAQYRPEPDNWKAISSTVNLANQQRIAENKRLEGPEVITANHLIKPGMKSMFVNELSSAIAQKAAFSRPGSGIPAARRDNRLHMDRRQELDSQKTRDDLGITRIVIDDGPSCITKVQSLDSLPSSPSSNSCNPLANIEPSDGVGNATKRDEPITKAVVLCMNGSKLMFKISSSSPQLKTTIGHFKSIFLTLADTCLVHSRAYSTEKTVSYDGEELNDLRFKDGHSARDHFAEMSNKVKETITLLQGVVYRDDYIGSHVQDTDYQDSEMLVGRVGVLVALRKSATHAAAKEFSEQLCQHISIAKPTSLGTMRDTMVMVGNAALHGASRTTGELLAQRYVHDAMFNVGQMARKSSVEILNFTLYD